MEFSCVRAREVKLNAEDTRLVKLHSKDTISQILQKCRGILRKTTSGFSDPGFYRWSGNKDADPQSGGACFQSMFLERDGRMLLPALQRLVFMSFREEASIVSRWHVLDRGAKAQQQTRVCWRECHS